MSKSAKRSKGKQVADSARQEGADAPTASGTALAPREARAWALQARHPDWTNRQIIDQLDVFDRHRQDLRAALVASGTPQATVASMSKNNSPTERAVKLRQVAAAFREFQRLEEETHNNAKTKSGSPEREELIRDTDAAAANALDQAAEILPLLYRWRELYGCSAQAKKNLDLITEYASLPTAERMPFIAQWYPEFVLMHSTTGEINSPVDELERWASELDRAARPASDSRQLAELTGTQTTNEATPLASKLTSYWPDPDFLEAVADEVHVLFLPPAPPANMEHFKRMMTAAIDQQKRHDAPNDHYRKVLASPCLRDKKAGRPKKGWQWCAHFRPNDDPEAKAVGAWLPPGVAAPSVPPSPIASLRRPENAPPEIILMGRYVVLAVVHDNMDERLGAGRPRFLAGFDLPRAFQVRRNFGPGTPNEKGMVGFDRKSIERALRDVKADLAAHAASDKKEQPWEDEAPAYLPLSEAVKLVDERLSLSSLSKLLTPRGEMRYMRKGRRCKVHLDDFRRFMKGRQSDPEWAKAYLAFLSAAGKGDVRFYWRCKDCGHERPEDFAGPADCPKCGGEYEIFRKRPPEPQR